MKRALCPSALLLAAVALVAPTTASAYDIWVNLGGPAADLEIDLTGTTLTVTSFTTAALNHNAGANCTGTAVVLTCNLVAGYNISGSHSADNFDVKIDGSTAYPITVLGRQGDDTFQLLSAISGRVDLAGDNGADTVTVGSSGAHLTIYPDASVRIVPGVAGLLGDILDVYADVHGFLEVVGTPNIDLITLDGSVVRSGGLGGIWDADAGPGDDVIDLAVHTVATTYNIGSAAERATFVLKGRDGYDSIFMSGDVTVSGGVYALHGELHDDILDMGGPCLLTAQDVVIGANTWTSQSLLDGGLGVDTLVNPCAIAVSGGSTHTNVW